MLIKRKKTGDLIGSSVLSTKSFFGIAIDHQRPIGKEVTYTAIGKLMGLDTVRRVTVIFGSYIDFQGRLYN